MQLALASDIGAIRLEIVDSLFSWVVATDILPLICSIIYSYPLLGLVALQLIPTLDEIFS